jgi:hypothetical protein
VTLFLWKQWRKPRKRIRELIKLGVKKLDAIHMGISRKSYWRLSKTLATNSGLSNAYFQKIGLISSESSDKKGSTGDFFILMDQDPLPGHGPVAT